MHTFAPTALSALTLPGSTNNVDVSGDFAYVAAGSAGLHVVNIANRSAPVLVASFDTPGNANDVRVVGSTAFVADGPTGLRIIDCTDPLQPQGLGAVDTPGNAQHLVVQGGLALVADGATGLSIIAIGTLTAPALLSTLALPGGAQGVDVNLQTHLAVVAAGAAGLHVIDIANPVAPSLLGSVGTGSAQQVALDATGRFAFVADFNNSFTAVDLNDPQHPVVRASAPLSTGGRLVDVATVGRFAVGADIFFVNGVPILDVRTPSTPVPLAILNFSQFGDDNGTGIAADSTFVYLTTDRRRLLIGQYLQIDDTAGIPPTVAITAPLPPDPLTEGQTIILRAAATDDLAVASVRFFVNGAPVLTDTGVPFEVSVTVPVGTTSLTLGAQARDFGDNVGVAQEVTVTVIPDPGTTGVGRVLDRDRHPVLGATVTCRGVVGLTAMDGTFAIAQVPTVQGDIRCVATFVTPAGETLTGKSAFVLPVSGGLTPIGDIVVIVDSDGDGLPDDLEVRICGTPICAEPPMDADGDGLSNLAEFQRGTDPTKPDTDFDGLKDGAEALAGLNPLNPDTDGDGFSDGLEVDAGSNPLEATSRPFFADQSPPGEALGVTFTALNNVSPAQDSDQDGFSDLVEVQAGTNPHDPISVPNLPRLLSEALSKTFAALNTLSPAQDSDQDGFSDLVEVQAGTNPHDPTSVPNLPRLLSEVVGPLFSLFNTSGIQQLVQGFTLLQAAQQDSDGDGMPDWFEIAHGLNPYDPTDAIADPDGDGLTNNEEYLSGTDPHRADTDGDGIPDGQEVQAGTAPLVPDTTPPTLVVTQPADAATLLEGQTITIRVEAVDNMAIDSVHITVNGAVFPTDAATAFALTFTVPLQEDTLIVRAAARDKAGNVGTSPEVIAFVTPDPLTTVQGKVVDVTGHSVAGADVAVQLHGLRGEFFVFETPVSSPPALSTLTPATTRLVSAVNFRNPQNLLQAQAFGEDLGPYFAARFTGLLRVPTAGTYTFMLGADDRARLVLNNAVVVDVSAAGAFTEGSARLKLPAGQWPMVVEYVRESGMAELQLSYVPPDGERQIVMPTAFLQDPAAFTTRTASDGTFVVPGVPTILGDVRAQAVVTTPDGVRFTGTSLMVPPVPAGVTDMRLLELRRE